VIALVLTLVLFPLVGAAAALLLQLPLPPSRVARFAFLYLLGVGVNGAVLYVAVPLVSLALVAFRWGSFATLREEPRERHGLATIVFALPLVVLLLSAAVIPTRDYDGRVTWLPKARAIALEHSITGPFFHGERGLNLHNRYPLLLPLDAATVMRLSGDTRNEAARWIYVLIPICSLIVMRAMLRAPWVAAAVAWLPVFTSIEGGALAAYSDFALGAFVGVAVLYLIESVTDARAWRVVGVFAAFAVLTKNEGAALAIAIVIAALLVRRSWWQLLAPIVLAEAILAYWRTLVPAAYDEQYEVLMRSLPHSLGRAPAALLAIVRHAADFSEWGLFWILVAAAIAICALRDRSPQFLIPLIVIVVALGAYTTALMVTSWRIEELANVAVNRLLSQLILPAACILANLERRRDAGAPEAPEAPEVSCWPELRLASCGKTPRSSASASPGSTRTARFLRGCC
jgi:hypothetical protein